MGHKYVCCRVLFKGLLQTSIPEVCTYLYKYVHIRTCTKDVSSTCKCTCLYTFVDVSSTCVCTYLYIFVVDVSSTCISV